jgi:hypothetical protein
MNQMFLISELVWIPLRPLDVTGDPLKLLRLVSSIVAFVSVFLIVTAAIGRKRRDRLEGRGHRFEDTWFPPSWTRMFGHAAMRLVWPILMFNSWWLLGGPHGGIWFYLIVVVLNTCAVTLFWFLNWPRKKVLEREAANGQVPYANRPDDQAKS